MTPFLSVDTSDLDRLGNRFRIVRAEMPRGALNVANDIGEIAADAIREEAPEGRTGALKRSIHHDVKIVARLGGGFAVHVISPKRYTGWVIEGRGWVYPVRAKVLHWVSKSGEDVFSMHARPTEPNPFHERGWERAQPSIRQRWERYAEQVGRRLAD